MTKEREPKDLLSLQLNRKLYFTEMQEKLVSVTYNLVSDELYTVDHAIPELIRIIDLLELEQRSIMNDIDRIESLSH